MKVGIVGIGNMGSKYVNKFRELRLDYVLIDSDRSKFENFPEDVPKYTDLSKALSKESITHLFVATSPQSHVPVAKLGINEGVNVMVEKPPALDTKSLSEVIELAQKKGVQFAVSEIELLSNSIQNLQKNDGWERGEGFRLNLGKGYINPFYDLAWHDMYIFHYLFGSFRIESIKEESSIVSLDVRNDSIEFSLQVAWLHPYLKRQWHLYSSEEETILNFVEDTIYYGDGRMKERDGVDKLKLMIENFLGNPSSDSSIRAFEILKEFEKISR